MEKDTPTGYSAAVTYSSADGFKVINTHEPEIAQLNVQKVWDDSDNNDGKRPYAVVITLYENGLPTASTLTLSEQNGWKGVWENMPRFHAGQRISYSVVETGYYQTAEDLAAGNLTQGVPEGYTVTHDYVTTDPNDPIAVVTNSYTPATTALNVQKTWDDDNNREGKRPVSVTVTLMRKVGENGTLETVKDSSGNPMTAILNDANDWDQDFTGLPRYSAGEVIYYSVEETPVAGYDAPRYHLDTVNNILTITNTRKVNRDVTVAVTKEWDDADNQDGIRPTTVAVTLYANGIKTSSTKVLNADGGWKAEWTGLYEYYKGKKIVYTVEEESVASGYTYSTTGGAEAGFVITNTHAPEKTVITVFKIWDDNDNQDGKRPDSVELELLRNGVKTGQTLVLSAASAWQGEFKNLDKYSDGELIDYAVAEGKVEGYNVDANGQPQSQTVHAVDGRIVVRNVHVIEKNHMTANKVWDDNNDQDGKRPDSITLHLIANGVHMGENYKRVVTGDGWTVTWEGLDKYSAGQPIHYMVYEEPIVFDAVTTAEGIVPQAEEGYTPFYVRDSETQITVTNVYHPETTAITAMKVWDDDADRDGIRPDSIMVKLLANGQDTGKTLTLSADNDWAASWGDLPVCENHGQSITYTVEEATEVEGYDCVVTNEGNVFTLTNKHDPVVTNISVAKIWDDEDDNDGMRPDGIIVELYADGALVEGGRVILSEENSWAYVYESTEQVPLYVFNLGKEISYYVSEVGFVVGTEERNGIADGYMGKIEVGGNGYEVTITNTHATEKVSVTVDKQWKCACGTEHDHPTSVQVALLKNGTEVKTVELSETNDWSYTWNGLYRYTDGEENQYTVQEAAIADYTTSYAYSTSGDGTEIYATVTNEYQTMQVDVEKVWKDEDDEEGLRPDFVTVQLYKNGVAFGEQIILSEDNEWTYDVCLPIYEAGVEIKWTVRELKVPKYYKATYFQDTLTVVNTLKYTDSPDTGDSSNMMFWIAMMFMSTAGLAGLAFYPCVDKKGKYQK